MGKLGLFLTSLLVILGSFIIMPDEMLDLANALYSIPPTPSWTTIEINNNQIFPSNSQINITASNYTDKFYFTSDGSILINITEFQP